MGSAVTLLLVSQVGLFQHVLALVVEDQVGTWSYYLAPPPNYWAGPYLQLVALRSSTFHLATTPSPANGDQWKS